MCAKNCENKTKPLLGCKGKCQMMKKLQQEEHKQAPAPGMEAEQKGEIFSSFLYNTCCRTQLFIDKKGGIHAIYRGIVNDSIRDMMHIVSTDNGKSFSEPICISNDNWVLKGCQHTGPSMTETKQVYILRGLPGQEKKVVIIPTQPTMGETFDSR